MQEMESLSAVLDTLIKRGYTVDFNQKPQLNILEKNAADFHIDKIYRFEGPTDPQDEAVLISISQNGGQVKGYLVNGYGISADEQVNRVIEKLVKK